MASENSESTRSESKSEFVATLIVLCLSTKHLRTSWSGSFELFWASLWGIFCKDLVDM